MEKNPEGLLKYVLAKLAEAPLHVKNHIEINSKRFRYRRPYFRAQEHIASFLEGKNENRLIVLPGLRGVGKTTILFQIYDHLHAVKKIEQDRILYFSTDELNEFLGAGIFDAVNVFIEAVHQTSLSALDKDLFILIDEAHFDKGWSRAAKIIFDSSKRIFLVITGSSALNLELSVDIARRATKESVFPLNFSEYLILKHDIFPAKGTAESIRNLIFKGDEESLNRACKNENELLRKALNIGRPMDKEWLEFLTYRDLPFGLNLSQVEVSERISSMISKVIEKDVFALQPFSTETRSTISRILAFLALQTPGGTSDAKLANRLGVSPTQVRTILEVLEKTHLIFSVKPYGSAGKIVRKPWKYYFLSPSITAAIRFKLGSYDIRDNVMLGVLTENLIAAFFFRMKETLGVPIGIFYDSDQGGVDFVLQSKDKLIPVEVSIGEKDSKQIKNAIKKYKSDYGIVICKTEKISKVDNIVYIPLTTFSFA